MAMADTPTERPGGAADAVAAVARRELMELVEPGELDADPVAAASTPAFAALQAVPHAVPEAARTPVGSRSAAGSGPRSGPVRLARSETGTWKVRKAPSGEGLLLARLWPVLGRRRLW
ncbi:hypothetical protein SSPO_004220 [Streptomyces antimycoticus]|uniref:Uncharacterized protein n=1 Tax=Streptomyces antimycoticus TaxID=68175 RepID=A0A499UAB5_9ACTN|nr:hypothetical protein SSPO_004220 [Streptomyces antimycoticus]